MNQKLKTSASERLRSILADYQEAGSFETWHEDTLVKIFESPNSSDVFYEWVKELTKAEKKVFVRMLKDFGSMDSVYEMPTGRALKSGHGTIVLALAKKFAPRWRRLLGDWISPAIGALVCGLLSRWLFNSFVIGICTAIVFSFFIRMGMCIAHIYHQNELLLRRKNSNKKPRRSQKLREDINEI